MRLLQAVTVGSYISRTSSQKVGLLVWRTNDKEDLDYLIDLLLAGTVTPVIDRTYPLREAAEALRRTDAGEVLGKVVITM